MLQYAHLVTRIKVLDFTVLVTMQGTTRACAGNKHHLQNP